MVEGEARRLVSALRAELFGVGSPRIHAVRVLLDALDDALNPPPPTPPSLPVVPPP